MKKYLDMIAVVLSLLAGLGELIKSVEAPGGGAQKKGVVMSRLADMFTLLKSKSNIDIGWEDISGLMDRAIDTLVGLYNATKVFRKSNG